MASFELRSTTCDGHIKALSRAIQTASKISKEALLEFTPDKMRLCARTDMFLVRFNFNKDFFSEYRCDRKHRCYIHLKALQMPFKSLVLVADREGSLRTQIRILCSVEDEVNNQIVFKIGAEPPAATLTYRLSINDLDPDRMAQLNAINRTIDYARVEIAPKQSKKERFLLSAFNSFAPHIDQVTIKNSQSEVKFIGSISPLQTCSNTTSEFTHKRDDFSTFIVREDVNITIPLKCLKIFLNFVETNKVQTFPKYIFEGMGLPAHFIYDANLYRGHFVTATPYEYIPEELESDHLLPITMGPNESFIADENVIQADDNLDHELYHGSGQYVNDEEEEEDEDGFNENDSEGSDFLDGNLDGLNATGHTSNAHNMSHMHNNSIFGTESIRSEMSEMIHDPEKAREILDLDKNPDEIENVEIIYSSDSEDE